MVMFSLPPAACPISLGTCISAIITPREEYKHTVATQALVQDGYVEGTPSLNIQEAETQTLEGQGSPQLAIV
jgi:hypothetical protein